MEVLFGEIQCHPAAISGFFLLVVKIHELMVFGPMALAQPTPLAVKFAMPQ